MSEFFQGATGGIHEQANCFLLIWHRNEHLLDDAKCQVFAAGRILRNQMFGLFCNAYIQKCSLYEYFNIIEETICIHFI